jgi:hypothetical protein
MLIIGQSEIMAIKAPFKVSRRKKLHALNLCSKGNRQADPAYELGLSTSTIKRAKRKQRLFGDIEGGLKKQGQKPLLNSNVMDVSLFLPFLISVLSFIGTQGSYNNFRLIFARYSETLWLYGTKKSLLQDSKRKEYQSSTGNTIFNY